MSTQHPFPRGRGLLAALLLAASGAALAHSGHAGHDSLDFAAGLAHPLTGADHLLAMVAVGLWATLPGAPGRRWLAPALFVATMALAALLSASGIALATGPALELGIAASVVALGALMLPGLHMPAPLALAIVGVSAWLHGTAHGLEAAGTAGGPSLLQDPAAVAFGAGLLVATALLHGAGLAAGNWMQRVRGAALKWTGAAIGVAGLAMLVSRI